MTSGIEARTNEIYFSHETGLRGESMAMTEAQRAKLESMSRLGEDVWFKEKGGEKSISMGVVEDEVYIMVGDYKHLIQRIRMAPGLSWDGSEYAYRTGYYTYDANMSRIVWGQYTQFLTEKEYSKLLGRAK